MPVVSLLVQTTSGVSSVMRLDAFTSTTGTVAVIESDAVTSAVLMPGAVNAPFSGSSPRQERTREAHQGRQKVRDCRQRKYRAAQTPYRAHRRSPVKAPAHQRTEPTIRVSDWHDRLARWFACRQSGHNKAPRRGRRRSRCRCG